jgi:ankyrin repeat protein
MESGAQLNLADKNLPGVRVEKLNFEILNYIVEKGLKVHATFANTSFVWSLELENVNLVKYFIEQGADVNQKYQNGETLLSMALKNSDLRSFRLLIESGADPRLAEAEINEKMTKDPDFAIYMKSLDLDSMIQKLTIRKNYAPKGKSTKSVPFFQGRTGLEAPRWQS